LKGDAAPSTRNVFYNCASNYNDNSELMIRLQSCERLALLAMTKPGQYLLEVEASNYYMPGCKLTRVSP
jgi:hypothetical protein